jgi:ribosome maturation factor RimP
MGYELWGCEYIAQGKHSLLRVSIDKVDGIQIDDCEQVSHQISGVLDVEETISGQYRLEVSSPGIPRPLFSLAHYQRYIGHPVKIRLYRLFAGQRQVTGLIADVREDKVCLLVDGLQHWFSISDFVKAHLTLE